MVRAFAQIDSSPLAPYDLPRRRTLTTKMGAWRKSRSSPLPFVSSKRTFSQPSHSVSSFSPHGQSPLKMNFILGVGVGPGRDGGCW